MVATLAHERPCQPGEVAGRRLAPSAAVGVAAIDVHEEASQRADILVVVVDDIEERGGLARPEELDVPARDLPAGDVAMPIEPEKHRLDRGEPGIGHAVLEDATNERQEVEMAGMGWGIRTRETEASDEQGPVEPSAVVADEPGIAADPAGQLGKHGGLVRMVGQEELYLPEEAALPPAQSDEERERPGRRRQPGCFGIDAEQRDVRWRHAGERRETRPIDRQQRRGRLEAHERAERRSDQLAVQRGGQPLGGRARATDPVGSVESRPSPRRGPEAREPPLQPDRGHGRISWVGMRGPLLTSSCAGSGASRGRGSATALRRSAGSARPRSARATSP